MAEMIECRCHKRFYAAKIVAIEPLAGSFRLDFHEAIPAMTLSAEWKARREATVGDYYVWSPCDRKVGRFIPAAEFNRDFHVVRDDRMNFGSALGALKRGRAVRRGAWAESQSIWMCPGKSKCIAMNCGDGVVAPWTPTYSDLFANDWEVVEAECPPK